MPHLQGNLVFKGKPPHRLARSKAVKRHWGENVYKSTPSYCVHGAIPRSITREFAN